MASFDVAKLLNKITQDIPGINTVLKALAKWDVSALTDVPDGAMQATTDTNNRLTIKKKVSGSYTPVAKLMHDVDTVDGYHASTDATANTIAVRNSSGALPGNILGNAATSDTATALVTGTVVPVTQGGTGATTASQARANLGAANGADFTTHIAKQASPSVEGHVKLDALAADGSNTAAPGGYGLGAPVATTDFNTCTTNGWYYGNTTALNLPPVPASYYVFVQASNDSNVYQKAYSFSGANCFVRTRMGGVWSDWAPQPIGITDSISTTSSTIAASATAVKAVNDSLGEVQVQGAASWSADGAPYPIRAQVYHNGKQWLALRANSVEPSEGEDWTELVGKQYIDAATPDLTGIIATGIITMWHGSIASIPFGWALCDGTNGTPDLRGRFVIGADVTRPSGAIGGGETPTVTVHEHTLTVEQMPSHTHNYEETEWIRYPFPGTGAEFQDTPYNNKTSTTTAQGGSQPHTHGASIESTLPPYYALAYIMKL